MSNIDLVKLTRDTPWGSAFGRALILGLVLGTIGSAILLLTSRHWQGWEDDWLAVVVGAVFVLVSLLMIFGAIHQFFAAKVPETEVAIFPGELLAGSSGTLRLRQAGPVRLLSLGARLVCEIRESRPNRDGKASYTFKYPYQEQIFAADAMDIPTGAHVERVVDFLVPQGLPPSGGALEQQVTWRIEVWGRVSGCPDFMHPFTVTVT
ncbi:MAG: hypothetical protein HGA96_14065 [Desulfobulbaceae bacterium]|nr:hypothetical protein [Desulfobulbaceae bacterium]